MGLEAPQDYVRSLRDGRVAYWDGEDIADITTHPRFKERSPSPRLTATIPRSAEDLASRIEMMKHGPRPRNRSSYSSPFRWGGVSVLR